MTGPVATTEPPPLPYRARPPQVLLGVGAVVLLSAGATVASAYGGGPARLLLFGLAVLAATFSVRAARTHLTSSEEILAACATGLALAAGDLGGPELGGTPGIPLVLAIVFLALYVAWPRTATWPIASWLAAQLAVLHGLHWLPQALHTELYLCVSLVGLAIALIARRVVARLALLTTAPWWLAGVVGGSSSAWVASGVVPWVSAALMVAAASGLVLARLREVLDPLLGPPRAVPVLAGILSGAAVTGALSSLGPLAMTITGYAGVLLATLSANFLDGWRRGLFLPIAVSAGVLMTALCVAQLVVGGRWGQLSLLLLLTAAPTVLLAVHRPADRPVAVPTAVGCLAGAVLLALAAGVIGPSLTGVLLTVLYGGTMTVAAGLEPHTRHATAGVAAACAVAALLPPVTHGQPTAVAVQLGVQGLFTLGFAWRSGRLHAASPVEAAPGAWRVGSAQFVLAAWIAAAVANLAALESYSLPAAAGLLLAAGPRLLSGPSWPSWAPGLLVAAVPSTLLAVATSVGPREVSVLLVAALAMVGGARWSVRAPVLVGAGTALALSVGLAVRQLPWPLGSALIIGSALLAVGMLRERHPVAGFGARLADLR